MQFMDTFCYVFLMITLAATCVKAGTRRVELQERKSDRRLNRREAALIVDNFPVEPIFQKPKIIYRRISRQRYGPPKSRHGFVRPKYGPPKPKPGKNYRNTSPKYRPQRYNKKRSQKPRYDPSKRPNLNSVYAPPKMPQKYTYKAGFGEPPTNFYDEYPAPKTTYNEPPKFAYRNPAKPDSYGSQVNPVDSYGAPIKPIDSYGSPIITTIESFPTSPSYPETTSDFENYDSDSKLWKDFHRDQKIEYSKKKQSLVNPDIFVTPSPDDNLEFNLNSYSDIYMHRENLKEMKPKPKFSKNKKPQYLTGNFQVLNRPWKMLKTKPEPDNDVIVGGQYAEPPARFVPKFQPSAPKYSDNDDKFSPQQIISDSDGATISPYVNYKNSNLAFSPQNLNDAFSI